MTTVTHLRSLQAVELAIREGSLGAAARKLGITQAAIGQRVRVLEEYLGTDLILRARSGLLPTPELQRAMADLTVAFQALERATDTLDFQRAAEIHIVAQPDWADHWLEKRLPDFRSQYSNVRFCINGSGDIPVRLGAPDLRVTIGPGPGEPLFYERYAPLSGPDNPRRISGYDEVHPMEGMPLLHLRAQFEADGQPGWVRWFETFGQRRDGPDRGVRYQRVQDALDAVRDDVGFLICGLSLVLDDIAQGAVVLPFPASRHITAPHPYRAILREGSDRRPQFRRFMDWLRQQAALTERRLADLTA